MSFEFLFGYQARDLKLDGCPPSLSERIMILLRTMKAVKQLAS